MLYTHVIIDASKPLMPFLTAAATGQTLVSERRPMRTVSTLIWRAAPMDENVLMPFSEAARSSMTLHLTVSMASIRTSKSPLRIAGMVSSSTWSIRGSMSIAGLTDLALSHATSAFGLPTVSVVARICLFMLLAENTSPSTVRMRPIPARTSPSNAYPPTAPLPTTIADAFLSLSIPSSPTSREVLSLMPSIRLSSRR